MAVKPRFWGGRSFEVSLVTSEKDTRRMLATIVLRKIRSCPCSFPPPRSSTIVVVLETTFPTGRVLAKVQIFSGLAESELSLLAQRAVLRNYSAGQSVFGEGEPCSGLFVVESGHVRIFKSSANGREQVLSFDGSGSFIAALPVFDGGSYPASVTTIDDATLLFVSKRDFQASCRGFP